LSIVTKNCYICFKLLFWCSYCIWFCSKILYYLINYF